MFLCQIDLMCLVIKLASTISYLNVNVDKDLTLPGQYSTPPAVRMCRQAELEFEPGSAALSPPL